MTGLLSCSRVGPIGPSPSGSRRLPRPSASAFRSAPEQKVPPAPVSTATARAGSASKVRKAWASAAAGGAVGAGGPPRGGADPGPPEGGGGTPLEGEGRGSPPPPLDGAQGVRGVEGRGRASDRHDEARQELAFGYRSEEEDRRL